nr:unnamed protein product [Callosobruchus chinensis]
MYPSIYRKMIASLKKGSIDDTEANLKQTAQDLVDSWTEELSQFKPADRITDADKKNDMKSLQRKLDKHLVLVVNQMLGDKKHYLLPQGILQAGETLRQAAERVLKQSCGPDLGAQIYGNAPCGFYKYKYPKSVIEETGVVGAKVFMYFARYTKGQIKDKALDFKWLDRTELQKSLPVPYNSNVMQMLIDE